ncbi:uncharacterized protein PITG_02334 [Phytophthora infestans T30-4]|uniref:Uncharacterized protein n=1 Tax=Phytophthora infestans (strain T30-4) TaxID=403677 RepID=D0MW23_PHYIT|nr:uncharacterized protein PITG_02334 [Phytophthora infestans T30-4]EEY63836.1 hypothetical protein PITG_02334 [Phytophthora infestans T30-4]|eukprot:XP_002907272.1 hypothetical protein PITG_02334 [Phytophthora infestans T30-4]
MRVFAPSRNSPTFSNKQVARFFFSPALGDHGEPTGCQVCKTYGNQQAAVSVPPIGCATHRLNLAVRAHPMKMICRNYNLSCSNNRTPDDDRKVNITYGSVATADDCLQ